MPIVPWRIAEQAVTILDPESKEPRVTLQFSSNMNASEMARLRITPTERLSPAVELEFMNGGLLLPPIVFQPRYLKAFERPDPNLHLDDDEGYAAYRDSLPSGEAKALYDRRRLGYLERREMYEDPEGYAKRNEEADAHAKHVDKAAIAKAEKASNTARGVDENQQPAGNPTPQQWEPGMHEGATEVSTPGIAPAAGGAKPYNPSPGGVQQAAGEDPSPATPAAQKLQGDKAGVESSASEKGMAPQGQPLPSTTTPAVDNAGAKGDPLPA